MTRPSDDADRDRKLRYALGIVGVVTLLYAFLIAQQLLLWVLLATLLTLVYLAWRFVRAHERLAAAATAMATSDGDRTATDASPDEE